MRILKIWSLFGIRADFVGCGYRMAEFCDTGLFYGKYRVAVYIVLYHFRIILRFLENFIR